MLFSAPSTTTLNIFVYILFIFNSVLLSPYDTVVKGKISLNCSSEKSNAIFPKNDAGLLMDFVFKIYLQLHV